MSRGVLALTIVGLLTVSMVGNSTIACASPLTVTTTVGGVPASGTVIDLAALPLGNAGGTVDGVSLSFAGTAGVVQGTTPGYYTAPYASGAEGAWFGGGNGPISSHYLTAGSDLAVAGSGVTVGFAAPQIAFGLLWGSIDSFNQLQVFNGATLLGTVTGGTLTVPPQPGFQNVGSTAYVEVTASTPFDRLVFSSNGYAFEFADLTNVPADVPEPSSVALLGGGLALLCVARFTTPRATLGRRPRRLA